MGRINNKRTLVQELLDQGGTQFMSMSRGNTNNAALGEAQIAPKRTSL